MLERLFKISMFNSFLKMQLDVFEFSFELVYTTDCRKQDMKF